MILKPFVLRYLYLVIRLLTSVAVTIPVMVMPAGCGEHDIGRESSSPRASVDAEAIEVSLEAASEYFHTRDLLKAEAILTRLIERAPREPRARELYGQVLLARAAEAGDRDDHDQTRRLRRQTYEQYTTLLELRPEVAGLHQSAGQLAQMLELDEEAIVHYRAAMRLDPVNAQPPFFAAQVLAQRGDHEEARALLDRAINLNPEHALAHASLANIAATLGDFDQALERIRAARRLAPGDVTYRVIESSILRRLGRPKDGLELLVGLPANVRAEHAVAWELAASYAALENHAAAAEAWINCFRSHPRAERAWHAAAGAGEQLWLAGRREQAWTWLEQAKLLAPEQRQVRDLEASLRGDGPQDQP